jgi:hypothetical protein
MKSGIYALKDPDTGQIRYIGRSKNIQARYQNHIFRCKFTNFPSSVWIAGLLKEKKKPVLELLEEHANPVEIEEQWISWGKSQGFELLNVGCGGYKELRGFRTFGLGCLQASGKRQPTKIYRDFYFSFTNSAKIARDLMRKMKNEMASLKKPEDKIKYEIWVGDQIIKNNFWSKKQKQEVYGWAREVQPKVKKIYSGLMVIQYE